MSINLLEVREVRGEQMACIDVDDVYLWLTLDEVVTMIRRCTDALSRMEVPTINGNEHPASPERKR